MWPGWPVGGWRRSPGARELNYDQRWRLAELMRTEGVCESYEGRPCVPPAGLGKREWAASRSGRRPPEDGPAPGPHRAAPAEEGQGDADAYTPGGVRPSGLTGTTAGAASFTGHPAIAITALSLAAVHMALVAYATVLALHSKKPTRRKAALEVLRILTGYGQPDPQQPAIQQPAVNPALPGGPAQAPPAPPSQTTVGAQP